MRVTEHISRKELKQTRFEILSRTALKRFTHTANWRALGRDRACRGARLCRMEVLHRPPDLQASVAFDEANKVYSARIGVTNASADPNDISFRPSKRDPSGAAEVHRSGDKYPRTNPGRLARYYQALELESGAHNQALEELKKLGSGSDKELAAMAQYQMANIYARTGKTDDAVRIYRAVADLRSVFVPRPLVLVELADFLRQSNPAEASNLSTD